jgi:hypothetical protein
VGRAWGRECHTRCVCYIQGRDVRMCGIIGVGSTVSGEVRGWGTRSWSEGKRKRAVEGRGSDWERSEVHGVRVCQYSLLFPCHIVCSVYVIDVCVCDRCVRVCVIDVCVRVIDV